jgi:DNA-directed RNA polymerase subunit H (RpoH/RPB5)
MPERFHYNQYLNIRKAFLNPEYRGLESNDPEMKYEEFSKLLLAQKYILLTCKYPNNFRRKEYRGRQAFVVFTRNDSEFHNRSKELISLLDKISFMITDKLTTSDLFLITAQELKKRTMRKVREYKHFNFNNILSVRFAIELPKANHCSKHTIITLQEAKELSEESYMSLDSTSYLPEDDAQNIWIGGFPGEVVKITRTSIMAGQSIAYKYITGVIPRDTDDLNPEEDEEDEKESED